MSILIKDSLILDESSPFNGKRVDVLVESGKISKIGKSLSAKSVSKIIEGKDLICSQGWFDLQSVFCEPGAEHKETIISGQKAAAAGGFTAVCVHGNSTNPISDKSTVEFVKQKADKLVDVYPMGAITTKHDGVEMAEMFDMQNGGALAFSDYKQNLKDSGIIQRTMQYANSINSFIMIHCLDKSLAGNGDMNEGNVSTTLGVKGIPSVAEEIMVEKAISIQNYYGGKLHISGISTAKSVELIKKAKSKNINITASVPAINLILDDTALEGFDTNYKVIPPLRTNKDKEALRKGVESGIIDCIYSDHCPQDTESKDLEFDLAEFGIINLQTFLHCIASSFKQDRIKDIISTFSSNPRNILGIKNNSIKEGELANLTVFSFEESFNYSSKNNYSKSINNPFLNSVLKGKVFGVINGSKSFFN
jgi:dihydroorotase